MSGLYVYPALICSTPWIYEQRPAEVKRWFDEAYPAIAARTKRGKAEIQFGPAH